MRVDSRAGAGVVAARAPVIKENIETEFHTASGMTDGRGRGSMVRSLLINPPNGGRATIQIGRFLLDYRLAE